MPLRCTSQWRSKSTAFAVPVDVCLACVCCDAPNAVLVLCTGGSVQNSHSKSRSREPCCTDTLNWLVGHIQQHKKSCRITHGQCTQDSNENSTLMSIEHGMLQAACVCKHLIKSRPRPLLSWTWSCTWPQHIVLFVFVKRTQRWQELKTLLSPVVACVCHARFTTARTSLNSSYQGNCCLPRRPHRDLHGVSVCNVTGADLIPGKSSWKKEKDTNSRSCVDSSLTHLCCHPVFVPCSTCNESNSIRLLAGRLRKVAHSCRLYVSNTIS